MSSIIRLWTQYGGGKTHSLIVLVYTLAIGKDDKAGDVYKDENERAAAMSEAESVAVRSTTPLNPTEEDETPNVLRARLFETIDLVAAQSVIAAYAQGWNAHRDGLPADAADPEIRDGFARSRNTIALKYWRRRATGGNPYAKVYKQEPEFRVVPRSTRPAGYEKIGHANRIKLCRRSRNLAQSKVTVPVSKRLAKRTSRHVLWLSNLPSERSSACRHLPKPMR